MGKAIRLQLHGREEELQKMFSKIDQDNSGEINYEEFKQMMHGFGISMPIREMKVLFSYFDEDDSDSISYVEFHETVFPNSPVPVLTKVDNLMKFPTQQGIPVPIA